MKKHIVFLFVIFATLTFSCDKQIPSGCLQAKVVRVTCASVVIQVLNNDSIGEDGWTDTFLNKNVRYDNVFTASNPCRIDSQYKTGNVFYITIGNPAASDCIVCALYDAPPKISYEVKTTSSQPCGTSQN